MKYLVKFLTGIFFFALLSCSEKKHDEYDYATSSSLDTIFAMKVIGNTNEGWGYEIFKNKKVLIRQTIIPAIAGRKRFHSEEQAERVAQLVLKKLSEGEGMPAISIDELDSLKIQYK